MHTASLLLAALLAASAAAPAQDDPGALEPLAAGLRGVLVLRDGRTYEGEVLEVRERTVALKLRDRSFLEVPLPLARGVIRTRIPYGTQGRPATRRAVLSDGRVLVADDVRVDGDTLVLVGGGAERRVPAADVRAVVDVLEGRRPVALSRWHLLAPSAFFPEHGELLAASRLTQLSATAGVLGYGSLEAGTALPFLYTDAYSANAQLALRAGREVWPWLRAAAGLHADVSGAGRVLSASGTLTLGSRERHLTLHAGPLPPGTNRRVEGAGQVGVAVAGTWMLGGRWGLVAEGWGLRRDGDPAAVITGAVRYRIGRVGLEAGAGRAFPDGALFPWLAAAVDVTVW